MKKTLEIRFIHVSFSKKVILTGTNALLYDVNKNARTNFALLFAAKKLIKK